MWLRGFRVDVVVRSSAMRIVIVGSGGVGGYFGGRLAASGADVTFLASGAHLEAMRTRGLSIDSPKGNVHSPRGTSYARPAHRQPERKRPPAARERGERSGRGGRRRRRLLRGEAVRHR